MAVFLGGCGTGFEDVAHNVVEALVGVVEAPGVTAGVLLHFQRGGSHSTSVSCLAGAEVDATFAVHLNGIGGGRHVGALSNELAAIVSKGASCGAIELVLGGARQCDVAGKLPDGAFGVVGCAFHLVSIGGDALTANFFNVLEFCNVNTVGGVHPAGGVREGDNGCAEFLGFFDGIDGHVAGAGHNNL